ncbi:hypothetical protein Taro_044458 [Colocasia esculenta]|uniref:Protein kinase domain-containing protein n=1 Tax=Colocasia esculenta TaxID=4460 RepID=A0A843WNS2_COLES|nr:hypothetical protein [Colocasia esculenta]
MAAAGMGSAGTLGPLLLHLFLCFLILVSPSIGSTNSGDASAMTAIALSINPLPSRWSTVPNPDPCGGGWNGVTCVSGRVTVIALQGASLAGRLAPEIANLSSLQTLALQNNQLGGDLPSLAGLANLRELYLGQNGFRSIPTGFFSGLTSLINVSLDHNPLALWVLPGDLAKCSNLVRFTAMNCSLGGAIPDFFDGLLTLQYLRLSYNYMVGPLPPSMGNSSIRELYLNNELRIGNSGPEQLSGTLDVLSSMTQLSVVWVQSNNFSGAVPDLSGCTSLVDLQLRDNQLTGVLPQLLASLPNLRTLNVSNNLLQGPFPSLGPNVVVGATPGNSFCNSQPGPCDQRVTDLLKVAEGFGYPESLARAWRGNNPCNGWLHVSCDSQGNITFLNFGSQNLGGSISDSIASFTALKVLKLENNILTGSVPPSLATLPQLQVIDVSNNNLTGDVPAFRPNVKVITEGNPLLGSQSGGGGSGSASSTGSPSSPNGGGQSKGLRSKAVIYAVSITISVLVVVAGLVYLWYKKHKNRPKGSLAGNGHSAGKFYHGQSNGGHGKAHVVETESTFVPMQELQRATNNFSEENILGRGGFGVVYKGEKPDGTFIAVKRMEWSEMGKQGMSEFKAEIEVLKKVKHRHLVALLGYCEHRNEKLLVYEYMPQGTLSQHLFRSRESAYPPLTWNQRLSIALDVARGLEYLHSLAQTSFIHRDLKPSNILLDNDLRAKVSDFGLVKLAPDDKNSLQTRLAGTFGYLAPEYASTGKVTTKVDVYAFGVVLMELITGRKALDDSLPDESLHLVSWLRRTLINREDIRNVVDANLDLDEEDIICISKVAELANHCTSHVPQQRPDMGHAVNVLVTLVGQWKPSSSNEEDDYNVSHQESFPQWNFDDGLSFNNQYQSMDRSHRSGTSAKPDMLSVGR